MRFWLACFVLLFVGAELLQWLAELGGGQSPGLWMVLGGLGLAAASNSAHLPRLTQQEDPAAVGPEQVQTQATKTSKERTSQPTSVKEQSAEDSISFKVRFPWQ